jgi:hypothetical protein
VVLDDHRDLGREEDLMPVPFVTCQHEITGAFADLPETAIPHMPGWEPVGKPEEASVSELPEQPTGKPSDSTPADQTSPADGGQTTTGEPGVPARPVPTKSKAAAESAKTKED